MSEVLRRSVRLTPTNSVGLRGGALSCGIVMDNLDIRNERNNGKMVRTNDSSDADPDFVTPRESFLCSGASVGTWVNMSKRNLNLAGTITKNDSSKGFDLCDAALVDQGSKSRKRCRTEEGIQIKEKGNSETRVMRNRKRSPVRGTDNVCDKVIAEEI